MDWVLSERLRLVSADSSAIKYSNWGIMRLDFEYIMNGI